MFTKKPLSLTSDHLLRTMGVAMSGGPWWSLRHREVIMGMCRLGTTTEILRLATMMIGPGGIMTLDPTATIIIIPAAIIRDRLRDAM